MMTWITLVTLSLLVPLLHAERECTQNIKWADLLGDINSLSDRISHECGEHYDESSLCDPKEMFTMVEHSAKVMSDIMMKTESIYKKHHKSHRFVDGLVHARTSLKTCANNLHDGIHHPVSLCFEKLENFLKMKESQSHCAWEIITAKVREIIQRLENRTVRRVR